ncbi:hypothetical protein [Caulobacter sp. Root487D2Y]|uniref:hypothetical protein n=1 Tax=Caulobacter sp. Root487D2Y TaxID=1736547 RepID=UPI000A5285F5|nr:hypothetical protein [Caulobacter sp. Root487D2Y]
MTSSDKVRGLIRLARLRHQRPETFAGALAASHEALGPALRTVREAEQAADRRSGVVVGLLTSIEEFLALSLSTPAEMAAADEGAMIRHEARLVDCAARMTEQMLRWAVTPSAPAYDPNVVARRLATLDDLMILISSAARTATAK